MSRRSNEIDSHNGEPGCQGLDEVRRTFQNFWDPTSYWTCEAQGQPATLRRCPKSHLYSVPHNSCVFYSEYKSVESTEPPSRPAAKTNSTATPSSATDAPNFI